MLVNITNLIGRKVSNRVAHYSVLQTIK